MSPCLPNRSVWHFRQNTGLRSTIANRARWANNRGRGWGSVDMGRVALAVWLLAFPASMPVSAQETPTHQTITTNVEHVLPGECPGTVPSSPVPNPTADEAGSPEAPAWQIAWGLAGLRAIPAGP